LAEKDAAGVLAELATCVDYLIVSQSQSARAMKSTQLAKIATDYFKPEQIEVIGDLTGAITYALEKVTLTNQVSEAVSAVLITGSVVTAGAAREIIKSLGVKK